MNETRIAQIARIKFMDYIEMDTDAQMVYDKFGGLFNPPKTERSAANYSK